MEFGTGDGSAAAYINRGDDVEYLQAVLQLQIAEAGFQAGIGREDDLPCGAKVRGTRGAGGKGQCLALPRIVCQAQKTVAATGQNAFHTYVNRQGLMGPK